MTDRDMTISPLRQRMIEDMTIRQFAPKTQAFYIRMVREFTIFFGQAPDQATGEDLRRYQLHLVSTGASANSINRAVTALRFFFQVTLGQRTDRLPSLRQPRKLPVVLSGEEATRMLAASMTASPGTCTRLKKSPVPSSRRSAPHRARHPNPHRPGARHRRA